MVNKLHSPTNKLLLQHPSSSLQVSSGEFSIDNATRSMPNVGGREPLVQMINDIGSQKQLGSPKSHSCSPPGRLIQEMQGFSMRKGHHSVQKRRSYSTDFDRDEAWERKRDLHLSEGQLMDADKTRSTTIGRTASDCCPGNSTMSLLKTGSLTDEDLEELRGSIDLGFGFKIDESCDLKGTLPALELYYEINRRYVDAKTILNRTSSGDSSSSSQNESWRIASPGDHPSEVKTRLRHWAQVVACSIKQACSPW